MRDYGKVATRFWSDPATQAMDDQSRLLALYLLTSPHTTMLGAFRIPFGYVSADLGWNGSETLSKRFRNLEENGFATFDPKTSWVFIHEFLVDNPIENPNQAKAVAKLFYQVPASACFLGALATALKEHGQHLQEPFLEALDHPFETLSKPLPKPFRNQEQEQEQEQKSPAEPKPISSKKGKRTPEEWPEIPGSPAFVAAVLRFKESRKATKHPMTPMAMDGLLKQLEKFTEEEMIEALEAAIIGGHQGVYPKKGNGKPKASETAEIPFLTGLDDCQRGSVSEYQKAARDEAAKRRPSD